MFEFITFIVKINVVSKTPPLIISQYLLLLFYEIYGSRLY